MPFPLSRPLVFLDLETTGPNIYSDRIIEIGLLKLYPDSRQESFSSLVNPGFPIPSAATAVHGLTDADVAQAPSMESLTDTVRQFIQDADLAGFNIRKFDLPMLCEEFLRCGKELQLQGVRVVDCQTIFHKMEERTLRAALRFYCQEEAQDAHRALADAQATRRVLEGQLRRYPELLADLDFLSEFSGGALPPDWEGKFEWGPDGEPWFAFGKYKGKSLREAFMQEPSYYYWMMEKDFLLSTKAMITAHFCRLYPHKKTTP
ncbi:MAG: 3'-5' exonuclease [Flavobacteriales bacterium]|nr:3'-5' exonuclease [Flavobacteriales bacterium]MDW8432421.1 3'-5' exonuclease [Flavobacteriales bacterium]